MTYDESATKDTIAARLVGRMLYVIEQYTCGGTEPLRALVDARYAAMVEDCHRQVLVLVAEALPLTREEDA